MASSTNSQVPKLLGYTKLFKKSTKQSKYNFLLEMPTHSFDPEVYSDCSSDTEVYSDGASPLFVEGTGSRLRTQVYLSRSEKYIYSDRHEISSKIQHVRPKVESVPGRYYCVPDQVILMFSSKRSNGIVSRTTPPHSDRRTCPFKEKRTTYSFALLEESSFAVAASETSSNSNIR